MRDSELQKSFGRGEGGRGRRGREAAVGWHGARHAVQLHFDKVHAAPHFPRNENEIAPLR